MPKLRKEDVASMDIDELEAAEYSDQQFSSYDGEVPPKDTILTAFVSKIWWTRTNNNDPMIKVLIEAGENEGDLEEYNGLPCWENMALTTGAKFKWAPFLDHFGLTIRDVKNKTVVAAEDDSIGAPVEKIGTFVPGSDESWCRIIIARERYEGEWQAHVGGWLPYDEDEEPEEVDDEADEAEDEELEEEEDDIEEEEEVEDEPEPPARTRRAAPGRAKAREAAKPAATARKTPAATTSRASARKPATAASGTARAKASAARPARGRRAADTDEPPF